MKKITFTIISLVLAITLFAQKYHYFSDRKGEIIKTDGSSYVLNNLSLMSWDFSMGQVTNLYGTSKLKCKEIDIDLKKVKSIEFVKESDGTDYIHFYAVVKLESGATGKYLIKKAYNNGQNNPYYSFVGKNDFGVVEVKIWDVKKVLFH